MASVVAHLFLAEMLETSYSTGSKVTFKACTNEHNKDWAAATPAGTLTLDIKNQLATDVFRGQMGKTFEVTITLLEEQ